MLLELTSTGKRGPKDKWELMQVGHLHSFLILMGQHGTLYGLLLYMGSECKSC